MLRQLTNKFLHRVRIHGGEFDSSARAMNRAEGSNSLQAELRKFRGSTFERKQMSTSIKRIALVAVAALGLGVVSVAPSQAFTTSDSLTLSSATATQLTGETLTAGSAAATLNFLASAAGDTMSVSAYLISAPAGNTAYPELSIVETTNATLATTATGANVAATQKFDQVAYVVTTGATKSVTAKFKVYMNAPTVAGTYVIRVGAANLPSTNGVLASTAQTLTITVTKNPSSDTVVASATSYITAGETYTATYAAADQVVTSTKTPAVGTNNAAAAVIRVTTKNANGDVKTAESFTATITGPGVLGQGTIDANGLDSGVAAQGRSLLVVNGNAVAVFPDGTSGVSTITISSAAGVVLATETVTFFGAAASITTTVKKAVLGKTSPIQDVLSVVVKDAAGVNVSNLSTLGVVSSDTTKIATNYAATATYSSTTGAYLIPVTPVAAGTANLVVTTNASSTDTTGISAAAVSVRVGSSTPASVSVTTDKSSYAPGEKATITVKLLDANGLEVAGSDTYTAIFATGGITSSYTLGGGSADISVTGTVSYADGGKTYDVYLPVTEGDVKFSWTTGTGLATANQGVAGSVTVSVSSAATSAAIDAANEAAQAASDATDAALAAADAADAATTKAQEAVDAVATLSAQVSKLITALKAQITTLTNLVIKIQKKVKA